MISEIVNILGTLTLIPIAVSFYNKIGCLFVLTFLLNNIVILLSNPYFEIQCDFVTELHSLFIVRTILAIILNVRSKLYILASTLMFNIVNAIYAYYLRYILKMES
jgi:hypothetical protein